MIPHHRTQCPADTTTRSYRLREARSLPDLILIMLELAVSETRRADLVVDQRLGLVAHPSPTLPLIMRLLEPRPSLNVALIPAEQARPPGMLSHEHFQSCRYNRLCLNYFRSREDVLLG